VLSSDSPGSLDGSFTLSIISNSGNAFSADIPASTTRVIRKTIPCAFACSASLVSQGCGEKAATTMRMTYECEERSVGQDRGKEEGRDGEQQSTEEELIDLIRVRVDSLTEDVPPLA
jgi:hypothetical protein